MDILGIGPLELLFILIITIIVLGPKDMVKAGRSMGKFMHQIVTSSTWQIIQDTSKEIKNIPTKLMREASLEEQTKDLPTIAPVNKEEFQPPPSSNRESPKIDPMFEKKTQNETPVDFSEWLIPPSDDTERNQDSTM